MKKSQETPTNPQEIQAPIATAEQARLAIKGARMRSDVQRAIDNGEIQDPKLVRVEIATTKRQERAAALRGQDPNPENTKKVLRSLRARPIKNHTGVPEVTESGWQPKPEVVTTAEQAHLALEAGIIKAREQAVVEEETHPQNLPDQGHVDSGSSIVDGKALPAHGSKSPAPEVSAPQRENTAEEQSLLEGILLKINGAADNIAEKLFNAREWYIGKTGKEKITAAAGALALTSLAVLGTKYVGEAITPDSIPSVNGEQTLGRIAGEYSPDSLSSPARHVGEASSAGLMESAVGPEHNLTDLIDQVAQDNLELQDQPTLDDRIKASIEGREQHTLPVAVNIGETGTLAYNVAPGQGFINILETVEGLTKPEAIELITQHRDELLSLDGFTFGGGEYHNVHIATPGELNLGDASGSIRSAIEALKAARN